MKLRKVLSLFVALAMMVQVMPLSLFANDMGSVAEYTVSESIAVDTSSLADNDELLDEYVEQLFGTGSNSGIMLAATYTGADALDGVNLEVYNALMTAVAKIASGEETSSVVTVELSYDFSYFGVDTFDDAWTAFQNSFDNTLVLSYLVYDSPYELYWYDKTASTNFALSASGSSTTLSPTLTVTFPVATAYQGSDENTVDSSKVTTATTAASYAQSLVSSYSSYSDEDMLEAFKEAICSLVSYEDNYADADFGDIWQLVYVFDQDTSTNVVCEGYSKAFQYLCDLAGLDCITVSGTMSGGTGEGEHMWNVVYLDGVNYLVDVTNSDDGSVGQDGGLFMVCADDADASDASGYTFTVNNQTVSYVYDSTTLELYPEDYLTLGTAASSDDDDDDDSSVIASQTTTATLTILDGADFTDENLYLYVYYTLDDTTYSGWAPGSLCNTSWSSIVSITADSTGLYTISLVELAEIFEDAGEDATNGVVLNWWGTSYATFEKAELVSLATSEAGGSSASETVVDTQTSTGTLTILDGADFTDPNLYLYVNYEYTYEDDTYLYWTPGALCDTSWTSIVSLDYYKSCEGTYVISLVDLAAAFEEAGVDVENGVVLNFWGTSYATFVSAQLVSISTETYYIDITTAENGTIATDVDSTISGATVTITATPDDGYVVSSVTVEDTDGNEVTVTEESDGTYTFIMPSSDVVVSATFEAEDTDATHTITLNVSNGCTDYVTAEIDKSEASEGETVTITAVLDEDHSEMILQVLAVTDVEEYVTYYEWINYIDNGDGTYTFTMPDNDVHVYVYVGNYYITTASDWDWSYGYCSYYVGYWDDESSTWISKSSVFDEGDPITFTISLMPDYADYTVEPVVLDAEGNSIEVTLTGSQTTQWYNSDDEYIGDGVYYTYSFTMPASDVTVSATFTAPSSTYSVSIADVDNGTVVADVDSAAEGDTVTLTVTPADGYEVSSVTVTDADGNEVAVADDYTFTMPASDVTITAVFEEESAAYSVSIADVDNGTVDADVYTAAEGDTVTLTITPDNGYSVAFVLVLDADDNQVTATGRSDGTYIFTMPASDVNVVVRLGNYSVTNKNWDWDNGIVLSYAVYDSYLITSSVFNEGDQILYYIATYPDTISGITAIDEDGNEIKVTLNNTGETSWYVNETYVEDGVYYFYQFTMPASDVDVSATFEAEDTDATHTITLDVSTGCADYVTAEIDKSEASEGDTVTITVTTDESHPEVYVSASTVTYSEDGTAYYSSVDVTDNGDGTFSFIMPNCDVSVTACAGSYYVTTSSDWNWRSGYPYWYCAYYDSESSSFVIMSGVYNEGNVITLTVVVSPDYATYTVEPVILDASGNSIEATLVSTGTAYWYDEDNTETVTYTYEFTMPASDVTVSATLTETHTHSLTHVEATDATCESDGNTEYWYCSDCDKYYSDEDATVEITLDDTVIDATGHDWGSEATFTLSVSAYSLMGYTSVGDTLDVTLPYSLSTSDDVILPVSYTLTINGVTVSLKGSDGTGSGTYDQTVDIGYYARNYSDSYNAMIPQASTTSAGDIVITATVDCSAYGSDCTIDVSDIDSWDFCLGYAEAGATTAVGVNADGMTITKSYESTDVSWSWSDDYSSATATFTCLNDSSHTEEVTATVTSDVTKEATCEEAGETTYTATVTFNGATYTDTATEAIEATGHNYVETVTDPTCTEGGYTTHTCSNCGDSYTDSETEATGHYYIPYFTWADDYSSATANFTCRDCDYDETFDAVITSETTSSTCSADGEIIYTATVTLDGDIYQNSVTEVINATGHDYGEPTFEWSDDYSTATATFTCLNDSSHTMEIDATVTSETTDATCTETGKTVYTATVTYDGVTYTDTVTVTIDTVDHTYGEPVWSWVWDDEDQTYTVTATFTCSVCGGTDKEDALVSSDTIASTCTVQGSTTYTATVDLDGTPYSDTFAVSLPLASHTEGEAVVENEVAATCADDGSYESVIYCSVCGEELSRETVTVSATGLHNYELTYTDPDTDDKTYTCSVCGATKVISGSSSLTIGCTTYGISWSEDTLFFSAGSWSSYEIDGGDSFLSALAVDGAILAITRSNESGVVFDGVSNYEKFALIDSWYTISPYVWLGTAGHTSADETGMAIIDCISDDGYVILYDANEVYAAYVAAGGLEGGDPILVSNTSSSYDITNITVYYPESVDHTWDDGVETLTPTCTAEGTMTYTCTVCGETKTEAIPATGHNLVRIEAVDATCTTDGNIEHWCCTRCGMRFSDENGTTAINDDDIVVPATGHTTETQNAKDATCTEDGYTGDEVCTVCGETITAGTVIPATGHTTEIQNAKDATCTEDGYTGDEVCTVCGETVTAGTVIPATGHSYGEPTFEWAEDYSSATATFVCANDETHVETVDATVTSVTTDPTCEADGSTVYTATVDFNGTTYTDEKTETTPAIGHDYVLSSWTWAADYSSATATFVCANDSTHVNEVAATLTSETTEATESTYGKTVYTASVTVDGVTYTSSQIETDNSVVVDEDCNVYEVEASDTGDSGTYFEDDSSASVAIQVDGAAIEIEYDTTTDTEIEISITTGGVTYTFSITVSGSKKSSMILLADVVAGAEAAGTTLDLSNFEYLTVSSADATVGTISVLNSTGETAHSYESVTIEPTCSTEGSVTYTCSVCGDTYTEVLEKTAHTTETRKENVVEATRTTDGSYDLVTYCTVCGEEISRETITVPATGGVDMMTIWLTTRANYTSVNDAIAKADALNPDDYTNFADVTAAIEAVNWNLNVLAQSIVNGYAESIEAAIASLIPVGTTVEDVVIDEPIEDTDTGTEDDEAETEPEPEVTETETNPTTGIALSLLPMAIAALAAVSAKRR